MSISGDLREETFIYELCKKISEKIDLAESIQNQQAIDILKDLGKWALNTLPTKPKWAREYLKRFN